MRSSYPGTHPLGGEPASRPCVPGTGCGSNYEALDGSSASLPSQDREELGVFYEYELELTHATAFGASQVGCLGLMAAVTLARNFLLSSKTASRDVCVSADVLSTGCTREMIYNVISDGACAVLLEKECDRNRILAYRQVTKGYYWNSIAQKNEIRSLFSDCAEHRSRHSRGCGPGFCRYFIAGKDV